MKMDKNAIIIRSNVSPKANYHDYREQLRLDFWFSCGYCSITEIEAWGISFEIDHYYPRVTHPELISDYENLMYSCKTCNQYKGDYYPNEREFEAGNVILRPDRDDPRDHIELENEKLLAKTPTGEFNIEMLYLNRKQLQTIRELRKRLFEVYEYIAFGVRRLQDFKLDKIRRENRLQFLKIKENFSLRREELIKLTMPLLKEAAHSPLLDEDSNKKEDLKRRREFLYTIKAII
jgi:hypothetical protein